MFVAGKFVRTEELEPNLGPAPIVLINIVPAFAKSTRKRAKCVYLCLHVLYSTVCPVAGCMFATLFHFSTGKMPGPSRSEVHRT